jgi:hypothetical protein
MTPVALNTFKQIDVSGDKNTKFKIFEVFLDVRNSTFLEPLGIEAFVNLKFCCCTESNVCFDKHLFFA